MVVSRDSMFIGSLAFVLAGNASAQSARGIVSANGQSLPGVVVSLVDSTEHPVASALTDTRGAFSIAAPKSGTYRLTSLRIGFRPSRSDPFTLEQGQTLERAIALDGVPFLLDAVRVVDDKVCRAPADSAAATFALWEQVRGALTAARLGAAERTMTATTLSYHKTLEPGSGRVRAQETGVRSADVTEPWRAASVDSLRRRGYVIVDDAGGTTYFAPDLTVLLSDDFARDHCLHVVRTDRSSRVGIAFEPVAAASRRVADITGTLWVNRATSELERLDFGYTGLPSPQARAAGGNVDFSRLRDGSWAIVSWELRMPDIVAAQRGHTSGSTLVDDQPRISAVQETGGRLVVVTRGADTVFARAPLRLSGVVTDSIRNPMAGARVSIHGTAMSAVSDAQGRFAIDGMLLGSYDIDVHTAALDSLQASSRLAFDFTDSAAAVTLRVPTARQLAATLCSDRRPHVGLLVGHLLGPGLLEFDSLAGERVEARWALGSRTERAFAKVDAAGTYRLCSVPVDVALDVSVVGDSIHARPAHLRIADTDHFGRVDLQVLSRTAAATLSGTVQADSSRTPIEAAEVALPDDGRSARTDVHGAFRLDSIAPGRHRLTVRRLGYGELDTSITVRVAENVVRDVYLSRSVTLDSVRVVETAPDRSMREFDDHRRIGLGFFLTREQIAKYDGRTMSSLLSGIKGTHIVSDGAHQAIASSRNQTTSIANQIRDFGPNKQRDCYSSVIVDGSTVFQAGRGDYYYDLNQISPDQIEAVEFYVGPSEVPAEYNTLNTSCGLLVVHTRKAGTNTVVESASDVNAV